MVRSSLRTLIFLLLSMLTVDALADFQLSPGVNLFLPFESTEVNSQNLPYLKATTGLGLELNMQINLPLALSLNLDGGYDFGSAKSQYSYTDTSSTATVADLTTNYTLLTGAVSIRFHLLNLDSIKIFGGYGLTAGSLMLNYLSSDFETKHGSTSGFHQTESAGYSSQFWEAGTEYFWTKQDGLQLYAKFYKIKTGHFSTLKSSTVTSSVSQVSLLYNHVVNWDFFWK